MVPLAYSVKTFRDAGLEARCARTLLGKPCYAVRNPNADRKSQREKWWVVTPAMWKAMQERGVLEGFDNCTLLGDIFSVEA